MSLEQCILPTSLHIESTDSDDSISALMIASQNGHVDVVNVLLQYGASVDLVNKVKLHICYVVINML